VGFTPSEKGLAVPGGGVGGVGWRWVCYVIGGGMAGGWGGGEVGLYIGGESFPFSAKRKRMNPIGGGGKKLFKNSHLPFP